ncbi:SMP-30/gluconolactonase/LRE family protein [Arcticibacter sp. MXS-1]|uniref:SMP-30/gluconolactonase/LRE family protein n=1 Tax=Arcticibacter sp. MXS-1 TaxID=3341726 RepID=UPI0035A911FF
MKSILRTIFFLLLFFSALTGRAQEAGMSFPVASGAQLVLISDQFSFTEGPAADQQGNVFFTDQPNNKIWKYATDGTLSVFKDHAGRSNGLFFTAEGDLIACADEHNQLWSISPQGDVNVLLRDFRGKALNGPNDAWVSPNGNIYFTDPYYQRDYWTRTRPELEKEAVYLLRRGDSQPLVLDESMRRPNGIIGSADGRFLYVADRVGNKTYRYSVKKDGTLKDKTLFADEGSDGMTMDNRGNVYLTGDGVAVYNRDGVKILHIPVPAKWTANVCFGGPDGDWLFITASQFLYKLKMQVRANGR